MADTNVKVVLTAQDNTGSAFSSVSSKVSGLNKDVSGLAKTLLGGAIAGGAALTAFLVSSAKAAGDAQVAMASMNATLATMTGKTIEVSTGLVKTVSTLKMSGIEIEQAKQKIVEFNLGIEKQNNLVNDAANKLAKGKITQAQYNQIQRESKIAVDTLNLSIKALNEKMGETDDKQEEIKRKIVITKEEMAAYRRTILDAAEASQKLGFDNEDAALSITRFFQATGDVNKAIELNNTAMDLAAAKNLDLATAASLVNQVLSGNGRVLKQYQIDIKDSATPLEALGQLHEAVMGQAQARTMTFEGQMRVISLAFEDFKKTIGAALLEALTPWVQKFTAWLNDPETKKNFAVWTANFRSWVDVLVPTVIGVFQLWWNVLKGIYDTITVIGDALSRAITLAQQYQAVGSRVSAVAGNFNPTQAIGNAAAGLYNAVFRAGGGPVLPSGSYVVGESGPELFRPKSAGDIVPVYARAGGGITVNIIGNTLLDDMAAEKIGDLIIERLKLSSRLT